MRLQRLVDFAHDSQSHQRVSAEFKEIVMTADTLEMQKFRPDRGDGGFGGPLRGLIGLRAEGPLPGGRKRMAVEFAVRGKRQGIEVHISGGNHVLG